MALFLAHSAHGNYRAPLAFAPLSSRQTKCCSKYSVMAGGNPLCVPRLRISNKAPRQSIRFCSSFFADADLLKLWSNITVARERGCKGGACTSSCSISLSADTLRWIFTGAAVLLMVLKNTAINKAFLVPLLALQVPRDVISWIRGEYGLWAAFLALLVRLFYYIPGELELPLIFALVVITAPYQAMDLRGTVAGTLVCAGVAIYLAYQHFSRAGGLKGSFQEGTFLASLAIVCLVAVPIVFFSQGL